MLKIKLKKLSAITLILSLMISIPALAANTENRKNIVLKYDDIGQLVLEENLQLKSSRALINKLNNDIDDAEEEAKEAKDSLYGLVYSIDGFIEPLDEIIKESAESPAIVDPNIATVAKAAKLSLTVAQNNLHSQIKSLDDMTEGSSDQLDLAKLNYEQAEITLVNTAQNMFVLYHQLTNQLKQIEISRERLSEKLELANKNIEIGLAEQITSIDLNTSILELDAACTVLTHQRDSLLLQIKGFLGLTYKDELILGDMPAGDRSFIDTIEFDKDLESAIENAMNIKVKEAELKASSIYGSRRKYELQIKENDAALIFRKKYFTLTETRDNLLVSENKLNAAKLKLKQGQDQYDKNQLSQTELKSLESDVAYQELTVKSNLAALFSEIENYKAMRKGML